MIHRTKFDVLGCGH